MIWVITWMIFPLIFLMTFDSFSDEDVFHKEAAMSLGANPVKRYTLAQPKKGCSILIGVYVALVLLMSFPPHMTLCAVSFMEWKYGVLTGNFTLANYAERRTAGKPPLVRTQLHQGLS